MLNRTYIAAISIVSVLFFSPQLFAQTIDIKDAILHHHDELSNLTVEFDSVFEGISVTPAEAKLGFKVGIIAEKHELFRTRKGYIRYEWHLDPAVIKATTKNDGIVTTGEVGCFDIDAKRVEGMTVHAPQSHPIGAVRTDISNFLVDTWMIDIAFGLRAYNETDWKIQKLYDQSEIANDHGRCILTYKTNAETQIWIFDGKLDYAMVHYEVDFQHSKMEYTCSDFRKVGDTFLPFKIVREVKYSKGKSGGYDIAQRQTLTLTRAIINDPENMTDGAFKLVWPKGTEVYDARIGRDFFVGDHDRTLSDDDIINIFSKEDQAKKASLEEAQKRIEQATSANPKN